MAARRSAYSILIELHTLDRSHGTKLADLAKSVADRFELHIDSMLEADRNYGPTLARHTFWTALREEHRWTLTQIADLFGVHHTTVLAGIRRVKDTRPETKGAAA